jgi:hypothetical protein
MYSIFYYFILLFLYNSYQKKNIYYENNCIYDDLYNLNFHIVVENNIYYIKNNKYCF